MKITKLIKELEKQKERFWDIEVSIKYWNPITNIIHMNNSEYSYLWLSYEPKYLLYYFENEGNKYISIEEVKHNKILETNLNWVFWEFDNIYVLEKYLYILKQDWIIDSSDIKLNTNYLISQKDSEISKKTMLIHFKMFDSKIFTKDN